MHGFLKRAPEFHADDDFGENKKRTLFFLRVVFRDTLNTFIDMDCEAILMNKGYG